MENVTKKASRKWLKTTIIGFSLLVGICNLPWPSNFLEMWVDHDHYRYSNGDATWRITENLFKNDRFNFRRKLTHPRLFEKYPGADSTVYRNFKKNPLAFWRYSKYLFDRRYTLPYISREDALKVNRQKGYTN